MKSASEVLLYIQMVRNFLKKNQDACKYFLVEINEEYFFDNLTQIAEKNYQSIGEPQLSKIQFDTLRTSMIELNNPNKTYNEISQEKSDNIFIDYRGYYKISYN